MRSNIDEVGHLSGIACSLRIAASIGASSRLDTNVILEDQSRRPVEYPCKAKVPQKNLGNRDSHRLAAN